MVLRLLVDLVAITLQTFCVEVCGVRKHHNHRRRWVINSAHEWLPLLYRTELVLLEIKSASAGTYEYRTHIAGQCSLIWQWEWTGALYTAMISFFTAASYAMMVVGPAAPQVCKRRALHDLAFKLAMMKCAGSFCCLFLRGSGVQ